VKNLVAINLNPTLPSGCDRYGHTFLKTITPEQASFVILKELQKRLLSGNALKVVK
jgi:hypothetical protein